MSDLKKIFENSQKELLEHYAGLTAHDFNNMINAVQSAAHMLATEKNNLGSFGVRYLDIIEKTTERMSEMTSRLQQVKSFSPDEAELFQPMPLVGNILDLLGFELSLNGDREVEIFGSPDTFGNLILWLTTSVEGLEEINISTRFLDEKHCMQGRFPLKPGEYCQLEFTFKGSRPENLYDPWAGPPRLFAAKRSVLKLRGEIESPLIDEEKWTLIIRLPSSDL